MASTELAYRPLTPADLAAAQALSLEAGWNQSGDDWRAMIAAGAGLAVSAPEGIVATGLTLPYQLFGWIAMILVTDARRRQGIASEMLRRCMAWCAEHDLIAGLDATEAGRQVYLPLGFKDVYSLSRLVRAGPPPPSRGEAIGEVGVDAALRPMTETDLPGVAAYDRTVFGADRLPVLRYLLRRWPEAAWVAGDPVAGFCLGRGGRTMHQIGSLSARDEASALALLQAALAAVPGPVLIDVADHQSSFRAALDAAGFTRQRGYVRMLLDRSEPLDTPGEVYAIAGPELG
ncbi:MAG: hypothetical protein RIM84_14525 [Alphaproteobacteria bacterium]